MSHGSRTRHSSEVDSAEILMDYGRASGFVQANWLTPVKIRKIALTGSEGYLEANYITQELLYYKLFHGQRERPALWSGDLCRPGRCQGRGTPRLGADLERPLRVSGRDATNPQ